MIPVSCPSCGAKYRLDEAKLGGRSRAQVKCPKCKAGIEISAPLPVGEPTPAKKGAERRSSQESTTRVQRAADPGIGEHTITTSALQSSGALELPADKKYSLAVLQGKASGEIFPILKSRTTIGRAGCDVVLDDPECSRQHAVVEVFGARAMVSDLNSTNGTFVEGKRVERAQLENHSEFRIGDHVLMLIITDRE